MPAPQLIAASHCGAGFQPAHVIATMVSSSRWLGGAAHRADGDDEQRVAHVFDQIL